MNRFRTRRKTNKEDGAPSPNVDPSPPQLPLSLQLQQQPSQQSLHQQQQQPQTQPDSRSGPFRRFGIGKKAQEGEHKPELDLSTVLPPTDDFRTSLLMTGLSARFSVLRDLEDSGGGAGGGAGKLDRASDDSVLMFSKSHTNMSDLARGLGDIAEVASVRSRPFARKNSFGSDDAASTSGSVMTRSRPNEGNNLFGGRQKIYKIVDGKSSATAGRALYEDDVALSTFQKFRLEEKRRREERGETSGDGEEEGIGSKAGERGATADMEETEREQRQQQQQPEQESSRSASPSALEFGRRRETNSTTSSSSTPSLARLSTAATSVTSNLAPSLKDWIPTTGTAAAAAAATGNTTAAATTTTTAPSPVERSVARTRRLYEQGLTQELHDQQSSALSRIDTLSRRGRAQPDLTPAPASTMTLADRLGDRRGLLSKASAPNLRAFGRAPSPKGSPRPSSKPGPAAIKQPQQQQQPQRQQSRSFAGSLPPLTPPVSDTEEPSFQAMISGELAKAAGASLFDPRADADKKVLQESTTVPADKMTSDAELAEATAGELKAPVALDRSNMSFLNLPDSPDTNGIPIPALPRLNISQPTEVHPMFRDSPLPTPTTAANAKAPPVSAAPESPEPSPVPVGKESHDSPTLGPVTSGLSGMVRQHLRAASNASSIYEPVPYLPSPGLDPDPYDGGKRISDFAIKSPSYTWRSRDSDWSLDPDQTLDMDMAAESNQQQQSGRAGRDSVSEPRTSEDAATTTFATTNSSVPDEFASQLADGARRVRERLTSYVDADPPRLPPALPPPPPPSADPTQNQQQQSLRSNPLGILKPKSSRGSLADRGRDSKANKILGLGSSTMTTTSVAAAPSQRSSLEDEDDPEGENVHAGVKAFRQARRELQRYKELETQQRHQPGGGTGTGTGIPAPTRDRRPPPVTFSQPPADESTRSRNRSGSDTSGGGSRPPPRMRRPYAPETLQPVRSPGLPGTDIRRSPHMPPQPYPGRAPSSAGKGQQGLSPYLRAHDPISPIALGAGFGAASSGPSSPVMGASRPPHGDALVPSRIDDSMRRMVRKKDISEPTFLSTTSQVPTVLLESPRPRSGPRSRSGSVAHAGAAFAPPLPPINPKRRNMLGAMMGRREDEMSASTPNLPLPSAPGISPTADDRSAFSISDDDDVAPGRERRKLRKNILGGGGADGARG